MGLGVAKSSSLVDVGVLVFVFLLTVVGLLELGLAILGPFIGLSSPALSGLVWRGDDPLSWRPISV